MGAFFHSRGSSEYVRMLGACGWVGVGVLSASGYEKHMGRGGEIRKESRVNRKREVKKVAAMRDHSGRLSSDHPASLRIMMQCIRTCCRHASPSVRVCVRVHSAPTEIEHMGRGRRGKEGVE